MDTQTDGMKSSADDTPQVPEVQINPLTTMTSAPPFEPVDDKQENTLAIITPDVPRASKSDYPVLTSLTADISALTMLEASGNTQTDNRSVAAWVESTTTETNSPTLERSPSLPSTLLEPVEIRARRDSNVSTICEQQQSIVSDLASPQQTSFSSDLQRSFSMPISDQHYRNDDNDDHRVSTADDDDDDDDGEDMSMKFLPVPESEESEVDKKEPAVKEQPVLLEDRSPPTRESPKKSSSVSFHASVSFDAHKPLIPHRRRRTSWNTSKSRPPVFQRSFSSIVTSQPPSLHAQILRKQFQSALSMPNSPHQHSGYSTGHSSSPSDNAFLPTSHTTWSPIQSSSIQSKDGRFLPAPSSASIISSDRNQSMISDASGRSGIESTNLETSTSEQLQSLSIDEESLFNVQPQLHRRQRTRSVSTSSDETPSTQSLSSSDDQPNGFSTAMPNFNMEKDPRKGTADKRRDILKQLMWLLEKKTAICGRHGLGPRTSTSPPKQTQPKSTVSSFAEFRTSFRSNTALNATARIEAESTLKLSQRSSLNSSEKPVLLSSQLSCIDPMNQSYTSVRSAHSDSSATTSVSNAKFSQRNGTAPLSRKRSLHSRNLHNLPGPTRDRKNSFNKSAQPPSSPSEEESKTPSTREIDDILNEHLLMINQFLTSYSLHMTTPYPAQNVSIRDFVYARLHEHSQQTPMSQRCSKSETEAFVDLVNHFQMNRAHHYAFLAESVRDLQLANDEATHALSLGDDEDDYTSKDGHIASNESSNTSSPALTRYASTESRDDSSDTDRQSFTDHPLHFFRTLSPEYILDCERTEADLQNLFDLADQQHALHTLNHRGSWLADESMTEFRRRLDALFVWFNLYYELTISAKKLSGLLRCDDCDDWPKLHFRSIITPRERKAKRADETHVDSASTDEEADETEESEITEESHLENESDILPKSSWPEEPLDHASLPDNADEQTTNETTDKPKLLTRMACYRNFVYYMDKRSYQVKYDGLARTLIERVAPVLIKTRLALLQRNDEQKVKVEKFLSKLTSPSFLPTSLNPSPASTRTTNDETKDKLVDTDNPATETVTPDLNIGEWTIEKWLLHVVQSCPTIKTIGSNTEEIFKHNWLELHQQLGLPSLLPLYFFIINVLLDVMNECLGLYNKPLVNSEVIEIDSLCRQQLVREAKLVLRDALATRLYTLSMLGHFIGHRQLINELKEFDQTTVKVYTHYKQCLSTVCVNRSFGGPDDELVGMHNEATEDQYHFVDEETSELIKEYYFARDLTVTLDSRTEIRDLCLDFCGLAQRILNQLKDALNGKTEKYYQVFAIDMSEGLAIPDGCHSAEVTSETTKPAIFLTSASVPPDLIHDERRLSDTTASFSEHKKNDIIASTREFRRDFDTIKQRATRVCHLAKTLIEDFSIAVEFKCSSPIDLWNQLRQTSYSQVKIFVNKHVVEDFDNFFVFVPPWLSTEKEQVEELASVICAQQTRVDERKPRLSPSYIVFLPKKYIQRQNPCWTGNIVFIQPSESTKFAVNLYEIDSLHLVVTRSEQWTTAASLFHSHAGLSNLQLIRRLPRDDTIRSTLDQLPEYIEKLSTELTDLVRTLNRIWDQDATKIYLTEIVKFDERTIESKLVDLVLYVYNSGFELFVRLYDLIPEISSNDDEIFEKFVQTMNEFFCEWCKCVTRKFKYISGQQARTAKDKVFRPKWAAPGLFFLRFLAKSTHLQLLSDEAYTKLLREMPAAFDALYGNIRGQPHSSVAKDVSFITDRLSLNRDGVVRSSSVSSTHLGRLRHPSGASGHRRVPSGGRQNELDTSTVTTPRQRISQKIQNLENDLDKKLRERKQIGRIFDATASTNGSTADPVISLQTRNIDFPWRRGTRIGKGGAGIAFRAVNVSNGSIVCMKEIILSNIASRSLSHIDTKNLRRIAGEIDMIMSINHPNIVRYFGIEKYKKTIYICMEYCLSTVNEFLNDIRAFQKRAHIKRKTSGYGSDFSEEDDQLDSDDARWSCALSVSGYVPEFVKQLLDALMALHENNIVHCDVKGDNIFIAYENEKYIVKLGDFNLSHRLELESPSADDIDERSTQKGTIHFKPPEPQYVCKSDIWALGCTVIEMLTGKLPWSNVARQPGEAMYILNQLLAKKGPPIPDELKDQTEACEFIQLCLKPDPDERPSARELLSRRINVFELVCECLRCSSISNAPKSDGTLDTASRRRRED